MMIDDDSLLMPYQIGGVFISHSQDETQEMLEAAKVNAMQWLWLFFTKYKTQVIELKDPGAVLML